MVRVYRTIEKRLNDAVADAITHRKLSELFVIRQHPIVKHSRPSDIKHHGEFYRKS